MRITIHLLAAFGLILLGQTLMFSSASGQVVDKKDEPKIEKNDELKKAEAEYAASQLKCEAYKRQYETSLALNARGKNIVPQEQIAIEKATYESAEKDSSAKRTAMTKARHDLDKAIDKKDDPKIDKKESPKTDRDDPKEEKLDDVKPIEFKGVLTDADPRDAVRTDSPHKVHVVKLLAKRNYQIDLIKKDDARAQETAYLSRFLRWDPYLRVEDGNRSRLIDDDDSGGDLNARIVFTPPKDDDYRIIATSMYGMGEYTVRVTAVPKFRVVNKFVKFEDKLAVTDKIDEGRPGCYCKVFEVNLLKGKTYTVDMISNQMDSYLRIEDKRKKSLAEDDDSGGFPNARIVFQPQETGAYRLIATTFAPNMVGAFTLTVRDDSDNK